MGPMEEKISWSSVIMSGIRAVIWDARRKCHFPVLIFFILEKVEIDFTNEEEFQTSATHIITTDTLTHIGYVQVQEVWRNPVLQPLEPGELIGNRGVQRVVIEADSDEVNVTHRDE